MTAPSPRPYLLGLSLFAAPALFFIARNLDVYTLAFLWPSLGVSLAVAVAVGGVTWLVARLTGSRIPGVLYVTLAGFWFLQFWHKDLVDLMSRGLDAEMAATLATQVVLFAAAAVALLAQWPAVQRAIVIFLGLNLVLLAVGELSAGWRAAGDSAAAVRAPVAAAAPAASVRDLNIYYVIVDGMSSQRVLQRNFGIDVSAAVQRLEQRHQFYVVPRARSSYNMTHLTLASIFYLGYPVQEDSPRYRDRLMFFPRLLHTPEKVGLFGRLDALGYRLTHVGNPWAPCVSTDKLRCLTDHAVETSFFAELMNDYAMQVYFSGSLIESVYIRSGAVQAFSFSINNNDALNIFMRAVEERPQMVKAKRNFFFIHHMNPHPPARDAQCELLGGGNYTKEDLPGYRTSVGCAFRRIQDFSDLIARVDPGAIVVVQADHGAGINYPVHLPFSNIGPRELDERFSIFNAIKLPADCRSGLSETLGNVETINLVLGCAGGALPPPQEPRSYVGFYEGRREFGTVRRVFGPEPAAAGVR